MDKTRKFDFESDVRRPEMDEILKVATDFSDPEGSKTTANLKEAISQNAYIAPKMGSEMSSMRQKMRKLAREIAEEESNVSEPSTENTEPETVDTTKSEIQKPEAEGEVEVVTKSEKISAKKIPVEKSPDSGKKPGTTIKKK